MFRAMALHAFDCLSSTRLCRASKPRLNSLVLLLVDVLVLRCDRKAQDVGRVALCLCF